MKKLLCALCLALLCGVGAGAVEIWVDGAPVAFPDAQPFVDENGRTLVPLRPVAEKLGLTVEWDAAEKTAVFSRRYTPASPGLITDWLDGTACERTLRFRAASGDAVLSADWQPRTEPDPYQEFLYDAAPVIRDGRVCAPVRALAEQFFCAVGWNEEKRRVEIETDTLADLLLSERYGARFDWSEGDRDGWTCKLYFDQTPPQWSVSYELDCTEAVPDTTDSVLGVRWEYPDDAFLVRELSREQLGAAVWGVRITREAAPEREMFTSFVVSLSAGDETQFFMTERNDGMDDPKQDWQYGIFMRYLDAQNARGPVDLFEQVRVLESLGIECPSHAEVMELKHLGEEGKLSEGNNYFENPTGAYINLLDHIGWGHFDPETGETTPVSRQLFAFDGEVANMKTMYTDFLERVQYISGGEFSITDVENDTSKVDWDGPSGWWRVSFYCNGRPYACKLPFMGDFIYPGIGDYLNEVLEKEGNPKRLMCCGNNIWLYNTPEWAYQFAEKTLVPLTDGAYGEYVVPE